MSSPWEFQDGGIEREPRGGRNRTPAYVHYHDIIPAEGLQESAGLDIIIDTYAFDISVKQRLTDEYGNTVERL